MVPAKSAVSSAGSRQPVFFWQSLPWSPSGWIRVKSATRFGRTGCWRSTLPRASSSYCCYAGVSNRRRAFRRLVHAADIIWPALISIFATGQANPFFLFFVFVLAAAAYRWGVWETVATAASAVSLLWLECLAFRLGFFDWVDRHLAHSHLPLLRVQPTDFEPKRLFMLSIYLLVMGLLLGYLAEQQKQLRSEKAVIARILGKVRVEAGLGGTLQEIVGELLVMYGAGRALIASQESGGQRVYVGEMLLRNGAPSFFRWMDPLTSDREMYLFKSPAETSYARRNGHGAGSGLGVAWTGPRRHKGS